MKRLLARALSAAFVASVAAVALPIIGYAEISSDHGGANGGSIRPGNDTDTCSSTNAGAIRYNTNNLWVCNGTAWSQLSSSAGAGAAAGVSGSIQFNSGGVLAARDDFQINPNGLLYLGSNSSITSGIEVGANASGNRFAFIDLTGDPTYSDYGLRIIRNNTGANTTSQIIHRGTGAFTLSTMESAPIVFTTSGTEAMRILPNNNVGIGNTNPAYTLDVQNAKPGIFPIANIQNADATGMSMLGFTNSGGTFAGGIGWGNASNSTIQNAAYFGTFVPAPTTLWSAGVERVRILANGNVGIGTTAPSRQLHVYGAGQITADLADAGNTGGTLYVQDSAGAGGNGGAVLFGAGQGAFAAVKGRLTNGGGNTIGDLSFSTRNATTDTALTERMRILANGNVGISANAPASKLHVNGEVQPGSSGAACAAANNGAIRYVGGDLQYCVGTTWTEFASSTGATAAAAGVSGSIQFNFGGALAGNNRLATAYDGNYLSVGGGADGTNDTRIQIGAVSTGNHYAYLDLTGDSTYNPGLRLIRGNTGANATSDMLHRGTGALSLWTQEAAPIRFLTSSAERMRIDANGRVGIGTNNPDSALHVAAGNPVITVSSANVDGWAEIDLKSGRNAADQRNWNIASNGTTSTLDFRALNDARNAGSTVMSLTRTGSVGIGTGAPSSRLHVSGEIQPSSSGTACAAANNGAIRYVGGALQYCVGTAWTQFASSTGATAAAAGVSGSIQFNSGGALAGRNTVLVDEAGNIITNGVGGGVFAGTSGTGNGYTWMSQGTNVNAGFINFNIPDGTRTGYIGWGNATTGPEFTSLVNAPLRFVTSGTEAMRLQPNGNLTINGYGKTINANEQGFSYNGQTMSHYGLGWFADTTDNWISSGPAMWLSGYGGLKFFTGGTPKVSIAPNGNVGIGTTNPIRNLQVTSANSPEIGIYSSSSSSWKSRVTFGNTAAAKWEIGADSGNTGVNNMYFYDVAAGAMRMAIVPNGNVGIGTTTPRFTLDVNGAVGTANNGGLSSNLYFDGGWKYKDNGWGAVLQNFSSGGTGFYTVQQNTSGVGAAASGMVENMHLAPGGNVGIGTASPGNKLTVYSDSQFAAGLESPSTGGTWLSMNNTSTGGIPWQFISSGSANAEGAGKLLVRNGTNGYLPMVIQGNGNVGIGNSSPGTLLSLGNTSNGASSMATFQSGGAEGSRGWSIGVPYGPTSNTRNFGFVIRDDYAAADRFNIDWRNGNVGINNSNVPGTVKFYVDSTYDGVYGTTNNGSYSAVVGRNTGVSSIGLLGYNGWGVYCQVGSCGGINAWTNTSDARLKERVAAIPDTRGLAMVEKLRPVTFHWRDKTRDAKQGQRLGFIAQEVEKLYPELVTTDPSSTMKSLSYAELVVPLTKAVQELKAENDRLKAANDNTQRQLDELRREIRAIRN